MERFLDFIKFSISIGVHRRKAGHMKLFAPRKRDPQSRKEEKTIQTAGNVQAMPMRPQNKDRRGVRRGERKIEEQ
jgi:hypothetical protein